MNSQQLECSPHPHHPGPNYGLDLHGDEAVDDLVGSWPLPLPIDDAGDGSSSSSGTLSGADDANDMFLGDLSLDVLLDDFDMPPGKIQVKTEEVKTEAEQEQSQLLWG